MKTAEEKAKEYASKECPIIISGSMQTLTIDEWRALAERDYLAGYNEAIEIAFKEGQSNPKIKQLEWKDNSNETRWHCYLPIGFYIIDTVLKYEPYRVRFYLSEYDYPKYERFCKTIEEAMMYAQKDFEARVRECLITE